MRVNQFFVHPYYERTLEKVGEELREGDGKRRKEENNRGCEGLILIRWDMTERRKPRWERERSKEKRGEERMGSWKKDRRKGQIERAGHGETGQREGKRGK
jgi:hypothetical protein